MKRRDFIVLLGSAAARPLAARAQQKAMPVVGYLSTDSAPSSLNAPVLAAFRQGLSETGYVEGQNLAIEYLWAANNYDRLPALAADLVGRKVDVIVTIAVARSVAAKNATSTIPIVFLGVSDPVGLGLVASLARPAGNVTGFSNMVSQLTPKRLELLSELVPHARVIALLENPNSPTTHREPLIADMQEAARARGCSLRS
jgi:putative tryptophan/tyrosine transport system substrate-binding protein